MSLRSAKHTVLYIIEDLRRRVIWGKGVRQVVLLALLRL